MGTSVKHVALASAQNLGSLMNPPTSATASSRGLQQFRDLSGPPAQQQQQQQQLAGGSFGGGLGYTQPFNATAGRSGRQSTGRANNAMVSASARGDAASARGSGGGIGGGGSSSSSSSRSAQPSARASARQAASSARSRVGGGATNAGGASTRAPAVPSVRELFITVGRCAVWAPRTPEAAFSRRTVLWHCLFPLYFVLQLKMPSNITALQNGYI
jgi:hypothetical protein